VSLKETEEMGLTYGVKAVQSSESGRAHKKVLGIYPNLLAEIANAPGPSPWYQRRHDQISWGPDEQLYWREAPEKDFESSCLLLTRKTESVIGIIRRNVIIRQLNKTRLLITFQTGDVLSDLRNDTANALDMSIIGINDIQEIDEPIIAFERMRKEGKRFLIEGASVDAHQIMPMRRLTQGNHRFDFAQEFTSINEILEFSLFESGKRPYDIALFIIHPMKNEVEVIPQDWFNGHYDEPYQGPDRAIRDPITGRIFLRGTRIGYIVLDESSHDIDGLVPLADNDYP
jgi:hypothetical protein